MHSLHDQNKRAHQPRIVKRTRKETRATAGPTDDSTTAARNSIASGSSAASVSGAECEEALNLAFQKRRSIVMSQKKTTANKLLELIPEYLEFKQVCPCYKCIHCRNNLMFDFYIGVA